MYLFFVLLFLAADLLQAIQVFLDCVNIRYYLLLHLLLIVCLLLQLIDLIVIVGLLNLIHEFLSVADYILGLLLLKKQLSICLILLLLVLSGGLLKLLSHFLCQGADNAIREVL